LSFPAFDVQSPRFCLLAIHHCRSLLCKETHSFCGVIVCGTLRPPASVHGFHASVNQLRSPVIEVLGENLRSVPLAERWRLPFPDRILGVLWRHWNMLAFEAVTSEEVLPAAPHSFCERVRPSPPLKVEARAQLKKSAKVLFDAVSVDSKKQL
jgi:hypothetical protein